jgi:branched-chain amino acid transport system permease protein
MATNEASDDSADGNGVSRIVLAAATDASKTALLAFGLCIPIVLLRTDQDFSNQLIIIPRVQLVAGLVTAAYIARFAWLLLAEWHRSRPAPPRPAVAVRADGALVSPEAARRFAIAGLLFLFAYPMLSLVIAGPAGSIKWIDNFGIQILIYVMLGWGLNIVVGLAGLLDLGYVAFYAVGAYSYALLASNDVIKDFMAELIGPWFWPAWAFWIGLPVAGILAAFWGIILGFPVLRLRGDYLAIVTLAFGEIIRLVLINWIDVTGGYAGISGIPRPSFFGIPFTASDTGFAATFGLEFTPLHRTIFLFYVILVLALITNLVTIRLRRLPVGRAWEALREDEIACRSLGINTTNTKLTAFAIGAGFGGFAGAFFAARQNFISPESFTFLESAVILSIVVLGGMGSQIGVAIAAIAMIGGTELLRELDWLKQIFGAAFDPTQYRMLLFGLAMVVIMIWRPRGLISNRQPTVFLGERRAISSAHVKEGHG